MVATCKVLELWNTSLGKIAVLGFFDQGIIPHVGITLKDGENNSWKVTGLGMEKTPVLLDRYKESNFKSIWDCQLEQVDGDCLLRVGDMLYIGSAP